MGKSCFLNIQDMDNKIQVYIKDSNLPVETRIGAVVRKEKVIIPRSDFIFEKNDKLVLLSKRDHLKEIESIFKVTSI